ncbi:uncharacterized protein KQ657_003109 [Scheffersomyces spartinae]|uniref:TMEM205-like domain-containing protein n=1 Tax=Scheffersomyces spartinae TaxID=45513 RepID=A0A9P8AGB5_9ASCO|nr:uncharacterized protein KQ657_003109 [Scheffersomyces spartinae]KAG7191514.1 hypothetical protein KQ657_003109 [Scheffersomyces spartinae]
MARQDTKIFERHYNHEYEYQLPLNEEEQYEMVFPVGLKNSVSLFVYSVTFGGGFFYSFIASPIAFQELERSQFSKVQSKVFPIYFLGQTVAPIIIGLTSAIKLCPFTKGALAVLSFCGALNCFWLLPVCRSIKEERVALEKEGKDTSEVTKRFGKFHGISTLVNMLSIISLGAYGYGLGCKLARI